MERIIAFFKLRRVQESLVGAAIGISIALLVAVLSWYNWGPTDTLSNTFSETQYSSDTTPQNVVIIEIDNRSLAEYGGDLPLLRGEIADVINIISEENPRAIGIDVMFGSEHKNTADDDKLINAVRNAGNVVLAQVANFDFGKDMYSIDGTPEAGQIFHPFEELDNCARETAHINASDTGSRIIEFFPVIKSGQETSYAFSLQVACVAAGKNMANADYKPGDSFAVDDWYIPLGRAGGITVNYRTGFQDFPSYSLIDILNDDRGEFDIASSFSNKIVLIGPYAPQLKDSFSSPLGEIYGIEIQGNVIESIVREDHIAYLPDSTMFVSLMILGLLLGLTLANLRIQHGILLLIGLLAAITLLWIILANDNFIKSMTVDSNRLLFGLPYPMMVSTLSFFGVSGQKYYRERAERKRISGTFGRFVTPQVLKEIMKSHDTDVLNPHGKLQELTIFFMDIRGYTTISEKLEPEEVFDLLNRLFAIVTDIFTKYEGTINKFIGDAVMVMFNAPISQSDHALRAVRSACEIQEALESFDPGVDVQISCGVGINTGDAMVGTVGSGTRMEYTCIGDAVNVAARLEGQAKEGIKIVIGPGTYEYVKDEVEVRAMEATMLKGKAEAMQLYEVTAPFKKKT